MDSVKEVHKREKNLLPAALHPVFPTQILPHTVFGGDIHQHSTVHSQPGDKTLNIWEPQRKLWFFGECRRSFNSLITFYMYAIMSYNTILSCISRAGSPFSPTKRRSFNGKARPTVYKSIPTLKACHLRGSCKHWSQLCVFARPPELIPSNFSAPLVPVIKEATEFKWAGSLVALSSYHIGLQSGLQCEEGTGANHWALPGLNPTPLYLCPALSYQTIFISHDQETNTEGVKSVLSGDRWKCRTCSVIVAFTSFYLHTCSQLIKGKLIQVVIICWGLLRLFVT